MDEELRAHLKGIESRMEGMETRFKSRMEGMETRFESRMDAMETRLRAHVTESCYGIETKLLRAFHGWARTMEVRTRSGSQAVAGMDERLALAEERISELERRKDNAA